MKKIAWNLSKVALQAAVAICMLAVLVQCHGCVDPGPIDPAMIARYQRAMLEAGPQSRDRLGPLSELLPPSNEIGPRPLIIIDEQTGDVRVELSLEEAIVIALANNLDIRVVSYNPGVSRQEVIQAAAVFDYVAFGGFNLDRQNVRINFFGDRNLRTKEFVAGVRQTTVTGAALALTSTLTWIRDHSFSRTSPNFEPDLTLSVTQPLLRGGWSQRNLASLRIARINNKVDMAAFRQQVEQTVTDVIITYWLLVQARGDLVIQEDLLVMTEATYQRVRARSGVDATAVEIKQSEAALESRRAALIPARKNILDVQDVLGRLLSDETINAIANIEIVPTSLPSTARITLDVADQLVIALEHSPLLEQARLAIQAADISVQVARNEQLPKLDFVGSVGLTSGGNTLHEAMDRLWNGDYFNYQVGLALEYPIGNRQRRALVRQRRYERLQAITQLQQTADEVATQVRERIRQVAAAHEEYLAQQKVVSASRDQLQALEDRELIQRMTPEFMQVKLQAQETLTIAERAELRAKIDYNTALAELDLATGSSLEIHRVRVAMPMILGQVQWDRPARSSDLPAETGHDVSPAPPDGNSDQQPASDGNAAGAYEQPVDQPDPDAAATGPTYRQPGQDAPPGPTDVPNVPQDAGGGEAIGIVRIVYPNDVIVRGNNMIDRVRELPAQARQLLHHYVAAH